MFVFSGRVVVVGVQMQGALGHHSGVSSSWDVLGTGGVGVFSPLLDGNLLKDLLFEKMGFIRDLGLHGFCSPSGPHLQHCSLV